LLSLSDLIKNGEEMTGGVNMTKTPKIAEWLLEHLGPNDPSIAGDLLERRLSDRSRLWYWQQVFFVVLIRLVGDVYHHLLRSIGVLVLGHLVLLVTSVLVASPLIIGTFTFDIKGRVFNFTDAVAGIPVLVACLLASIWTGRVVTRRLCPNQPGIFLLFAFSTLLVIAAVQIKPDGTFLTAIGNGPAPFWYEFLRLSGLLWAGLRKPLGRAAIRE
jgi:hypothetical protein